MEKRFLLLFFFFFSFAQAVFAADTVYFGVNPPDENVRFADKFSLRMEAAYPAQYDLVPDTSSLSTNDFDLIDMTKIGEASSGTLKSASWSVVAQAFCIGKSTFPAITWNLVSNGKTMSSAFSPEFNIKVAPLFNPEAAEKEDIRDIYSIVKFPNWLLILLSALIIAAFAWYAYKKLLKEKVASIFRKEPWKDIRTPYQKAYDRTAVLENSTLLQREKIKEFYIGLSTILRLYLAEEYGIAAELYTTKDLARQMKATGIGIKNVSAARDFLNHADMVKFAKLRPKNIKADLSAIRDLLQSLDFEHTPVDIGAETSEPSALHQAFPASPVPAKPVVQEASAAQDNAGQSSRDDSRWMPKPPKFKGEDGE